MLLTRGRVHAFVWTHMYWLSKAFHPCTCFEKTNDSTPPWTVWSQITWSLVQACYFLFSLPKITQGNLQLWTFKKWIFWASKWFLKIVWSCMILYMVGIIVSFQYSEMCTGKLVRGLFSSGSIYRVNIGNSIFLFKIFCLI